MRTIPANETREYQPEENNKFKWHVIAVIILALLWMMFISSCKKKEEWPNITCKEQYTYHKHTYLNETVTKEYGNRVGDTDYVSIYNPLTGRMVWIKRKGTYIGTNPAKVYNDDVDYLIICTVK